MLFPAGIYDLSLLCTCFKPFFLPLAFFAFTYLLGTLPFSAYPVYLPTTLTPPLWRVLAQIQLAWHVPLRFPFPSPFLLYVVSPVHTSIHPSIYLSIPPWFAAFVLFISLVHFKFLNYFPKITISQRVKWAKSVSQSASEPASLVCFTWKYNCFCEWLSIWWCRGRIY